MKNKIFVLVLALLTCLSGSASAFADAPAPTPSGSSLSQAFTPEDLAKMRETLNQLSKAMDKDTAPNAAPAATPATSSSAAVDPPKKTTMADVANKALDMMGAGVAVISSNLQKIAPHVWRIMIMQQYAKAAYEIAEPLCLFLGGLLFILVMRLLWKPKLVLTSEEPKSRYNSSDWTDKDTEKVKYAFRSVVPSVYLIIVGLWLGTSIGTSVKYVINPEYYAVKDILTLVTDPKNAPE
jgi:hypothetical protein